MLWELILQNPTLPTKSYSTYKSSLLPVSGKQILESVCRDKRGRQTDLHGFNAKRQGASPTMFTMTLGEEGEQTQKLTEKYFFFF